MARIVALTDEEEYALQTSLSFLDQDANVLEHTKLSEQGWQTLCAKFGDLLTAKQAGVPANVHNTPEGNV